MIIQSRLDSQLIHIELDEQLQYGIMLSGGLDSAVLLCLMLEDCKQKEISPAIQPFTIPKHDGAELYISNIIKYANYRFGVALPETVLVGNPDAHHRTQSTTAFAEILNKYKFIDFVYTGVNQNPPSSALKGSYPIRTTESPHPKIVMPFVNLYKTHIVDFVYQYGLTDLLDITHSCTGQKVGRCNQCFQCNERKWAFEQLNQQDTGKM